MGQGNDFKLVSELNFIEKYSKGHEIHFVLGEMIYQSSR